MFRSTTIACLLCSLIGLPAATVDIIYPHDGLDRECRVYTPDQADETQPRTLILVLHWKGGDGIQTHSSWGAGFCQVAESYNQVVFFPTAIDGLWNAQAGTAVYRDNGIDDLGFLTGLMDHAAAEYGCDPDRVFVTGASNGGNMTWLLARERPQRIAGIAPLIALLPEMAPVEELTCLPTFLLAGTEDPQMPYDGGLAGGGAYPVWSGADSLALLAGVNGLEGSFTSETLADADPDDGCTTDKLVFTGSLPGNALVHYRVNGGGHAVPGDSAWSVYFEQMYGRLSRDYITALHIGEFFQQYGTRPLRQIRLQTLPPQAWEHEGGILPQLADGYATFRGLVPDQSQHFISGPAGDQ